MYLKTICYIVNKVSYFDFLYLFKQGVLCIFFVWQGIPFRKWESRVEANCRLYLLFFLYYQLYSQLLPVISYEMKKNVACDVSTVGRQRLIFPSSLPWRACPSFHTYLMCIPHFFCTKNISRHDIVVYSRRPFSQRCIFRGAKYF